MASLSDVAKKVGVSVATVSLALRGRGQVAAKTAEQVRQAAEELNYKPNPLLASLATKKFRAKGSMEGTPLAILEFAYSSKEAEFSALHRYTQEIDKFARSLGYTPKRYALKNTTATGPIYHELYYRMVQGVFIVGNIDMAKFGGSMPWEQFAAVACARFSITLPFHTVRPNIFQGVKLAFQKLQERGYQRIGFALGQHDVPIEDDEARHGAALALENRYLRRGDRIPPFSGPIQDPGGLVQWVCRHRPDAVVAFSPGHYWNLRDAGYNIPQDIGFASLHLESKRDTAHLSGLLQNRCEISRQSVLLMDQLIRNREKGLPALPLNILVPSTWNEGTTLAT